MQQSPRPVGGGFCICQECVSRRRASNTRTLARMKTTVGIRIDLKTYERLRLLAEEQRRSLIATVATVVDDYEFLHTRSKLAKEDTDARR